MAMVCVTRANVIVNRGGMAANVTSKYAPQTAANMASASTRRENIVVIVIQGGEI